MSSSYSSGRDAGAGPGEGADASGTRSSAPPAAGGSNPPASDGGDSIAWWDLKESRDPSPAVQLRAIAEIALAIDAARSPNLPRGGATMHPHGALITSRGRAKVLPDLPLAALGDEERVFAPEIKSGGKPDARSDIFALGAMLFEALTGEMFHDGARVQQELDDLRRSKERGEEDSPAWYEDLLSLAARATHVNPAARGPQPKIIAKEILHLAGVDVAGPEALAILVTEAHSVLPPAASAGRPASAGGMQSVRSSSRPDGRYKSDPPPAEVVSTVARSPQPAARASGAVESNSSRPTVPGSIPEATHSSRPTVPGSVREPLTVRSPVPGAGTVPGVGMPADARRALGVSRKGTTPGMGTPVASQPPPATAPVASATPPPAHVESRVPTRVGLARPQPDIPRPARMPSGMAAPSAATSRAAAPRPSGSSPPKVPSRVPTATGMPTYKPSPVQEAKERAGVASWSSGSGPPSRSSTPLGIGSVQPSAPSNVGTGALAPPISSTPPPATTRSGSTPPSDRGEALRPTPPPVPVGEATGSKPPPAPATSSSYPPPPESRDSSRPSDASVRDSGARFSDSVPPASGSGSYDGQALEAPRRRTAERARLIRLGLVAGVAAGLLLGVVGLLSRNGEETPPPAAPPAPADGKAQPPIQENVVDSQRKPTRDVATEDPPGAQGPEQPGSSPGNEPTSPAVTASARPVPPKPVIRRPAAPPPAARPPAAAPPAEPAPEAVEPLDDLPPPPLATETAPEEPEPPLPAPPLAPVESKPKAQPTPGPPKVPSDYGI